MEAQPSGGGSTGAVPAEGSPEKPRLMISKIVCTNFKSYAGVRELGPFHKVIISCHSFCTSTCVCVRAYRHVYVPCMCINVYTISMYCDQLTMHIIIQYCCAKISLAYKPLGFGMGPI